MHSFWRRLGSPLLLVVMAACSGTSPSASQTSATGSTPASETTFELCGGGAAGVFSLDPASGSLRWRLCATPESTISPVAATEDLAFVATSSQYGADLIALDAEDGAERWRVKIPALNESFHMDAIYAAANGSFAGGGVIFLDILSDEGVEHVGYDAATGEERLRIPDDGGLVLLNTDELLITGEGFAGQLVGAGPDVSLAAYNRLTGERQWAVDEGISYFGAPWGAVRADDVMIIQQFVDAAPHGVAAVNLATGQVQWRHADSFAGFDSDGPVLVGLTGAVFGPTAADDAASEPGIHALDVNDGDSLWEMEGAALDPPDGSAATATSASPGDSWRTMRVTRSAVIARAGSDLVALEPGSGKELWRRIEIGDLLAADHDRTVVTDRTRSRLALLDAADGRVVWTARADGAWDGVVVLSEETLLLRAAPPQPAPLQPAPDEGSTALGADDPAAVSVGCAGGTPVGGMPIGQSGELTTVLVSADQTTFCVLAPNGIEDVIPVEPRPDVSTPEVEVISGSLGVYLHLVVPAAWGFTPQISDGTNRQLPVFSLVNGVDHLVLDVGPPGAPEAELVERTFVLTGVGVEPLGEVTAMVPPIGSPQEVLSCLRRQGLNLAMAGPPPSATSTTGLVDSQPFDPAVARTAWAACRSVATTLLRSTFSGDVDGELAKFDCLADHGFIQLFLGGEINSRAHSAAWSACTGAAFVPSVGLTCDVYLVGEGGALSAEPVRSAVGGFFTVASAAAPKTAAVGERFTISIPSDGLRLAERADTFDVVEHRELLRTFTIAGATVLPDSLVQDPPADVSAQTSATATETTVELGWISPVVGGGQVQFPSARFDVVTDSPTDVTITLSGFDSTLALRGADGAEPTIRALCTTDANTLARITVS